MVQIKNRTIQIKLLKNTFSNNSNFNLQKNKFALLVIEKVSLLSTSVDFIETPMFIFINYRKLDHSGNWNEFRSLPRLHKLSNVAVITFFLS